ncbi:DUF6062 family protein [Melioribacteraceae bacterium 4301-Me]|uniref:DUF6062 family protein n=1 Tax=Pyranulibacter aquaticus TaxID=3163344 RepID=UPI00359A81F1
MRKESNNQMESSEISAIKRGLSWVELKESLKKEGCPICMIMLNSLEKYFEFLLYEYVLDAAVHKKMLASFGMCNTHTYMLKETEVKIKSDGLNISVLYETLLQKELKLLSRILEPQRKYNKRTFNYYRKEILQKLAANGECPACENQKHSESFYTHEIIRLYKDEEFQKLYENNNVLLCRRHFLYLLNEAPNEEVITYFVNVQKIKLNKLFNNLTNFIQKHDYQSKIEITEDEKKSWQQLLEYSASKKNVNKNGYNEILT